MQILAKKNTKTKYESYGMELKAINNIIHTLKKAGYENIENTLDEAFFGKGNILTLARAIEKTYNAQGGFSKLLSLIKEH